MSQTHLVLSPSAIPALPRRARPTSQEQPSPRRAKWWAERLSPAFCTLAPGAVADGPRQRSVPPSRGEGVGRNWQAPTHRARLPPSRWWMSRTAPEVRKSQVGPERADLPPLCLCRGFL